MDIVSRATRDVRSMAVAAGVSVVVVTHTAMVLEVMPEGMRAEQMRWHAYLNLAAAAAILYGVL